MNCKTLSLTWLNDCEILCEVSEAKSLACLVSYANKTDGVVGVVGQEGDSKTVLKIRKADAKKPQQVARIVDPLARLLAVEVINYVDLSVNKPSISRQTWLSLGKSFSK